MFLKSLLYSTVYLYVSSVNLKVNTCKKKFRKSLQVIFLLPIPVRLSNYRYQAVRLTSCCTSDQISYKYMYIHLFLEKNQADGRVVRLSKKHAIFFLDEIVLPVIIIIFCLSMIFN